MSAARDIGGRISGRPGILLWIAFLVPGLAWFAQLNVNFLLAAYACSRGSVWVMHGLSVVALVLAGAGLWAGWLSLRQTRGRQEEGSRPGGRRGGAYFLSLLALLMGAMFAMSIVANALPNLLVEPCR